MARLMILTDRAPHDPDWKGAVIWRTILSLCETHHEVLVATSKSLDEIPLTHSRLTVIRPVKSWRADQLPKLVRVLMTYQPQVIHAFALQDGGLWPSLTLWPYFSAMCMVIPGLKRYSTVFDSDDCGAGVASWHQNPSRLTAFSPGHSEEFGGQFSRPVEVTPLDLEHEGGRADSANSSDALIPVPVSEWENSEKNLVYVRDLLLRHPEVSLKIVGGWGDWPSTRRREGWQVLGPVAGRVNMGDPLDYRNFVDELRRAGALWLEPLKRKSWKFLLCSQLANQLGKELFVASPLGFELLAGSTANSLSRLYSGSH
jgi:hypothetical protein